MMNPVTKEWEKVEDADNLPEEKQDWLKLYIGEEVQIKGRMFKVRKITKKDVVLRGI